MSRIRLGVNPIMWSNDDLPTLGSENSLEQCLSEAREAGFQGIELGHKFPRDPDVLKALLARYDMELIAGWYGGRLLDRSVDEEWDALQDHLALLQANDSQVFIYAEVSGCVHGVRGQPLEARLRLQEDAFDDFGRRLTDLAERLQARGMSFAYHQHMGTVVQTIDELHLLMKSTADVVGLTLDTGHLVFAGGDPESVIRTYGHRVNHVHLKDVRRTVVRAAFQGPSSYLDAIVDGVFTVPGDGDLQFEGAVSALCAAKYEGWWVIEADQDPALANPGTFARLGADHVTTVLDKALAEQNLA